MLQALLALAHPLLAPAFTAWGVPVTWIEIAAFILSLWMVVCEMHVHALAWPLAMVSSLLYAILFADSKLYGEASLQLFFVAMSVWGWWQWLRGHDASGRALAVHRLTSMSAWMVVAATTVGWPAVGWLLHRSTDSDVPYLDALPTVGSIAGTFLLGRKFIENWLVWILVNGFSVALFAYKGLWLTVILYALFTALSGAGWIAWRRNESHAHLSPENRLAAADTPGATTPVASPDVGPHPDKRALRIAIVGTESTGKTQLTQAMAQRLEEDFGLRSLCVGEFLREWCDQRGRTPRCDEQLAIAQEQQRRIAVAAAWPDIDVVLCDTTPVMTAVYSVLLFDDHSIDAFARACQQDVDATLLTAVDLPWIPDGLQRDGPQARAPVDALVRERLNDWRVDWSVVSGSGPVRAANALDALRPLLYRRAQQGGAGRSGLFTQLLEDRSGPPRPAWVCERCDEPQGEHLRRSEAGR